jgi:hypothetical protein
MNGTQLEGDRKLQNYFNYFTEIEECFRRCRSLHTAANPRILLSPIDWALIESWKEAGVPLQAVLTGIERTFERWQKRGQRFRKINGLGYCSQEVLRAAEEVRLGETQSGGARDARAELSPFSKEEVAGFLTANSEALAVASTRVEQSGDAILREDLSGAAASLRDIARASGGPAQSLEDLERHLTALEEKLAASLTRASSVELLARLRAEVEQGIAPYRGKMMAAQIESLERQFLKKRLFEHYEIQRLSLFYL